MILVWADGLGLVGIRTLCPPTISTWPLGNTTPFAKERGYVIEATVVTVGVVLGLPMVMMWAFVVAGESFIEHEISTFAKHFEVE